MTRLANAIIEGIPILEDDNADRPAAVQKALGDSPVFVIDNVADYAETTCPRVDGMLRLRKDRFPNIAPPFDLFWMEYRDPFGAYLGAAIAAGDFNDAIERLTAKEQLDYRSSFPAAKWITTARLYVQPAPGAPAYYGGYAQHLVSNTGADLADEIHPSAWLQKGQVEPVKEPAEHTLLWALYPFWIALSLLHCRNVGIREVPPNRGERRRAERHGLQPPITYKTLVIEPLKKVLETEGDVKANGFARALHICRGHFRSYQEKPLFGKYAGTFFIPSHVRGSATEGSILKRYEVRTESRVAEQLRRSQGGDGLLP